MITIRIRSLRIVPALWVLALALTSCLKHEDAASPEMGYAYFPSTPGRWSVFDVDSITYSPYLPVPDTARCQVKEIINTGYPDAQGRPLFKLERYVKYDEITGWSEFPVVWTVTFTGTTAEVVEENIRYVKLIFPVAINRKWNGNAFNTGLPEYYVYSDVDVPSSFGPMSFDSTLTVIQKDETTLISEEISKEVYAKNTGLIYRKFKKLRKYSDGTIYEGSDVTYTISAHGILPAK